MFRFSTYRFFCPAQLQSNKVNQPSQKPKQLSNQSTLNPEKKLNTSSKDVNAAYAKLFVSAFQQMEQPFELYDLGKVKKDFNKYREAKETQLDKNKNLNFEEPSPKTFRYR